MQILGTFCSPCAIADPDDVDDDADDEVEDDEEDEEADEEVSELVDRRLAFLSHVSENKNVCISLQATHGLSAQRTVNQQTETSNRS